MEMYDQECCKVIVRFAFDVVAMFLAFLPFILLTGNGAHPFQRGFYCDDESIRYPFRPDTVSQASLYQGTLLISTAIILLVELFRYIHSKCTESEPAPHSLTPSCSLPSVVILLFRVLGSMYFGFAVTLSLIDVGKYSAGRLKPYFIAVCRPDPASYNCTSAGSYVENFRCLQTDMAALTKARTSFPALHATLVSYFAAYLLIYLQVRITWKPVHLLRHVLQAACYAAAIYVSISRVTDNAHSWSEILVSFVAGNVIGILVVLFVCRILQLASDSVQEKKQLLQQEMPHNEASVTIVSTQPNTPIIEIQPKPAAAIANNFPVYNLNHNPVNGGGGGNVYGFHSNVGGFHGNVGGFATAYSPAQQQLSGMRSSFVNCT